MADGILGKVNRPKPEYFETEKAYERGQLCKGVLAMYLTHLDVTMPGGGEQIAREFYGGILGLREITKPEPLQARGGVWFDVGGLELHLSVEDHRVGADTHRHFGLGCGDVDGLKARVQAAGVAIEDGSPAPGKRFFVHDPFGNRIEIHAPRGLPARGRAIHSVTHTGNEPRASSAA